MHCGLEDSIPDWIIEHPESRDVFLEFGLDESCGGKSLEYLCQQRNISPTDVLRKLEETIQP